MILSPSLDAAIINTGTDLMPMFSICLIRQVKRAESITDRMIGLAFSSTTTDPTLGVRLSLKQPKVNFF
jgi:hypothetical protein